MRQSQVSTMEAMRNMLPEFNRTNGRSESGNAEGGTAVGKSPREAIPTAVRESALRAMPLLMWGKAHEEKSPLLYGPVQDLLEKGSYQILVVQERRRYYVMMNRGISAKWDAEKALFPLRLVRRGVGLPSQGGLEGFIPQR